MASLNSGYEARVKRVGYKPRLGGKGKGAIALGRVNLGKGEAAFSQLVQMVGALAELRGLVWILGFL